MDFVTEIKLLEKFTTSQLYVKLNNSLMSVSFNKFLMPKSVKIHLVIFTRSKLVNVGYNHFNFSITWNILK